MDDNKKIENNETELKKSNDPQVEDGNKNKPNLLKVNILPLQDVVVFPYTLATVVLDNEKIIETVTKISEGDRLLAIFPDVTKSVNNETSSTNNEPLQNEIAEHGKNFKIEVAKYDNKIISKVGTLVRIVKLLKFPDKTVRILVRGLKRVSMSQLLSTAPEVVGVVEEMPDLNDDSLECAAMAKNAQNLFQEIMNMSPNFPEELKVAILNIDGYSRLVDLLADTLNIGFQDKIGILTTKTLNERLHLLMIFLNREIEVLHLGHSIQSQVSNALSQTQREFFLREQLKAIKKELGEDNSNPDVVAFKKKMADKKLPEAVVKAINKEMEKMEIIPQSSPDYHVSYNYIDWILSVPWSEFTKDKGNIQKAKKQLDADHYGLKDVKERILELLAVLQMKKDKKSPIICFVGPPGVGKTSLGKSIAGAMGRNFTRMSLGGVRDEAEIRGHRRTYIGALPGRIIQGLKKAGSSNPVFMLDEIDKLGNDFRGDPSSALLEVLDPQQNNSFNDHYLELDYDLSSVMFIATANILDTIPSALIDRMEIIRLPGYTPLEKMQIAKRYLVPRQILENGLEKNFVKFSDEAIDELITYYTKEAGVRNLERVIANVCRKITRKIIEKEIPPKTVVKVELKDISSYLGKRKFILEEAERKPEIGLAIGMAWTSVGGTILPIECNMMPGKGILNLTGSLGNVMKESAQAAFSYIKSNYSKYSIDPSVFEKNDFHIHVPDGATPKDGPSAGITIAISLISLLTQQKVKVRTAMTGEITLRGKITAIGGLKEKVIAALRSGIDTVIVPKENDKDMEEIPDEVKNKIKFVFVETIDEAIDILLMKEDSKSLTDGTH